MQAIISDIIVSQAGQKQTGNLLISQTLNNSSSNSVSFAEMLNSFNRTSESADNDSVNKTEQTVQKQTERTEPVEKSDDIEKSQRIKEEDLAKAAGDDKKTEEAAAQKQDSEKKEVKKADSGENKTELAKKLSSVQKNDGLEQAKNAEADVKNAAAKKDSKLQKNNLSEEEKKALLRKQNLESLTEQNNTADNDELSVIQTAGLVTANVQENPDGLQKTISNLDDSLELTELSDTSDKKSVLEPDPKQKINVVDLRTKENADAASKQNAKKDSVKVEYNSDNSATITMELNQQTVNENILSLDGQTAASNGSDFQAMVNNQLQANVPDFVRAGTILLKDNDKGTINLVLHPDDLGNVKIHLSMDGKTLNAHITVNTKEALEVFKENAQTLREAFAKNGFDTASFDVSYNGNSNGNNQTFEEMYDGSQFMARKAYGDFLSGGNDVGYIPDSYDFSTNSEYSINIVA